MLILDFIKDNYQLIGWVCALIFILGKYKMMFDHHEKILDKHEKSIDKIIDRLDAMGNDLNFIKGCMFGKQL